MPRTPPPVPNLGTAGGLPTGSIARVSGIAAAHGLHDTVTAFLPPLLPGLMERLALSNTAAGFLAACLQLPSMIQPFIGHLADRRDLRLAAVVAPAVSALLMALLGLEWSYGALVGLLLATGVSSAFLHSTAPVYTSRLSGTRLGRGMGLWMVGGEAGRTLGPLVVVGALGLLGPRGLPWLALLGGLASGLMWLSLRGPSKVVSHSTRPLAWRPALRRMLPLLVPLAALITSRSLMTMALTVYLPTFLTGQGTDLWLASASLSLLEAAGVVGALLGGSLSDRLGRRTVLVGAQIMAPLCLFAFLGVDSWLLRLPLLLLLGLAVLSIGPVLLAMVHEYAPDNRALANGVYMFLSFAIRSAAAVALGTIGDAVGLLAAFAISGGVMLVGLPLVGLLPARRAP